MTTAVLVLSGVGLAMAGLLAVGRSVFRVEVDRNFELLMDILPGANCGACGYPGCSGYAKALAEGEAKPDLCPAGGGELPLEIGEILGIEVIASEPVVAIVACAGGDGESPEKFIYQGISDCNAAHVTGGGFKSCNYGCLGMGSCISACKFDAIRSTPNGLVRIDPEKCTGCRQCVEVCPRGIIEMVPKSQNVHVLCNNPQKAKSVKAVCSVGCTGCKLCSRQSKRLVVEGALASVDTTGDDEIGENVALSCPQGTIYDSRFYSLESWLCDESTRKDFKKRSAQWKKEEKQKKAKAKAEKNKKEESETGSKKEDNGGAK